MGNGCFDVGGGNARSIDLATGKVKTEPLKN
jgi:hypothetical protein